MGQITVFSGPERRRRWTDEQRLKILSEAFAPGACVSAVARRHEVSTGQLYTWRSRLMVAAAPPSGDEDDAPGFAQAVVVEDRISAASGCGAAVVVDLPRGRRVTVYSGASPALATTVLKALR